MKFYQQVIIIILITITGLLFIGAGALAYAYVTPEEAYLPPPVVQTVEVPYEKVIEKVVYITPIPPPTAVPTPIPIPIVTEELQVIQPACEDRANLIIETPYFKTWKEFVTATITVQNTGTCAWEGYSLVSMPDSTVVIPLSIPISNLLPGQFETLEFDIPTQKGLSEIRPVVLSNKGLLVTMPLLLGAEPVKFNYADPLNTIPVGTIVINYPTQDWAGLKIDVWKPIPGLPGWWVNQDGETFCWH